VKVGLELLSNGNWISTLKSLQKSNCNEKKARFPSNHFLIVTLIKMPHILQLELFFYSSD
jgi:hypothetical protein